MHTCAPEFLSLFGGYPEAYGTFQVLAQNERTGKLDGRSVTLRGPVTVELWDEHLTGKLGLGIIPLDKEGKVRFACIDVDVFDIMEAQVMKGILDSIRKAALPLVVCWSKSGGAHLFLFLQDALPAGIVREKMREMAAFLGLAKHVIHPRQVTIAEGKGELGQWLNMPYFDSEHSNRYALNEDGRKIEVTEFNLICRNKSVTLEQLTALRLPGAAPDPESKMPVDLPEGPPCLQILLKEGFHEKTRKEALYNLAVYAKKSETPEWREETKRMNAAHIQPALSENEVEDVLARVSKGGANYSCRKDPICFRCNPSLCKARKFGQGPASSLPLIQSISKLNTVPAIWFVGLEGFDSRLELSTEQIMSPRLFQGACLERLNIVTPVVKNDAWESMLAAWMKQVEVIEAPRDSSPEGLLLQHLEQFCKGLSQARVLDDVRLGRPFHDTESKRYTFTMRGLLSHLDRQKFTHFRANQITKLLKDYDATPDFTASNGHGVNIWHLPEAIFLSPLDPARRPF